MKSISSRARAARPNSSQKIRAGTCRLLEVEPDRYLPESNAILWYLAGGTPLAPDDRIHRAEALRWMFFEQHSLEPNLGAAWFWLTLVKGGRDLQVHALEDWMEQGYRALTVMENHLRRFPFFAADHYTIADIALYAYTHIAHEIGFDLTGFPAVPRVAQAHRRAARPYPHGVAAGPHGNRRLNKVSRRHNG